MTSNGCVANVARPPAIAPAPAWTAAARLEDAGATTVTAYTYFPVSNIQIGADNERRTEVSFDELVKCDEHPSIRRVTHRRGYSSTKQLGRACTSKRDERAGQTVIRV